MDRRTDRSLAFDLLATDLDDPESLTAFVVAHTITPARALFGVAPPRPNEGRSYMIEKTIELEGGGSLSYYAPWRLDESSRAFDPLVRALLLFAWLFPDSVLRSEGDVAILDSPGSAVLDDAAHLLSRPHEAIADLVAGLLGAPLADLAWNGTGPHRPGRNDPALAELTHAQRLVAAALDPVADDPDTHLINIGLDRMEWLTARDIDKVLRSEVRRRLVWFGTFEPGYDFDDDGEPTQSGRIITLDRGVFGAEVPETIVGLVMLDLTEQLGRDRSTGKCAHCGSLMSLNPRQSGRARRGQPIYHEDCLDEHRLGYFRQKSRDRYARAKTR